MLPSYIKWFIPKKEKEILLPVSVSIAQQRLNIALANPITIPGNMLLATKKYSGSINGTDVCMNFTSYERNVMRYSMHGQLLPHSNGAKLVMTVAIENQFVVPFIIGLVIFLWNSDFDVAIQICLIIFLILLYQAVMAWHLGVATGSISEQIYRIVTDEKKVK